MRPLTVFMFTLFCAVAARAAVVTEDIEVEGKQLRVVVSPSAGGAITQMSFIGATSNMAGGNGLLQEGFGVASYYVPNRRINTKLEVDEQQNARPVITYSYDCDGPNISGLHVIRVVEPLPDEASVRVTWTIANLGKERQWVAPWVRNEVAAGGSVTPEDRLTIPTTEGIRRIERPGYYAAARNWVAVTDPVASETVYAVFDANHLHSVLGVWDPKTSMCGFQAAFVPRQIKPGESWTTTYRINAVKGLQDVHFATDELAAQLRYGSGKLLMYVASARALPERELYASVRRADGTVWKLTAKRFSIDPARLIRCTYNWAAPADGVYEFLAEMRQGGQAVPLGKDTGSPHGGFDTQFAVGKTSGAVFEPWTDAPEALARGARTLERPLAVAGDVPIWFDSPLEKVFAEDRVKPSESVEPIARIALARNEYESFQIVLSPDREHGLAGASIAVHDLTQENGTAAIPASDVRVSLVRDIPVRVPSYFEGPTGSWPDPLVPVAGTFDAPGGRNTALWLTVYAPPELPAGKYRGLIELQAGGEPIELGVEARVYGFTLPVTPALKTDFGYAPDVAMQGSRARGGTRTQEKLDQAYAEDALVHRVTLRPAAQLPAPGPRFQQELDALGKRLERDLARGITTVSVPAALLDAPEQLALANNFIAWERLQSRAFVHLANQPPNDTWGDLLKKMELWKAAAPDIPILVTANGLDPFIPENLDLWGIHTPVMDTLNSGPIMKRVLEKKEIWWYVNQAPPRPYANFFVDFTGIEHRILFWQAAVIGIRGLHYWSINYAEPGQDPWKSQLDITPVNGDGCLVYPGADGPVSSIRWETVRDGIEDYDYLALFLMLRERLARSGKNAALLQRASAAYAFEKLVPNLIGFARDPQVLLNKREELGALLEEMSAAQ